MVVNSLFELSDSFDRMLEYFFLDCGIVSSFPFGSPADFKHFIFSNEVAVHIFKMKRVSSVLGNILHVNIDVVDSLTHVAVSFTKLCPVCHGEVRFDFRIGMDPDIDESVQLADRVFPECWNFPILFPFGCSH